MKPVWIIPDWPAPPHVRAISTTRCGGSSVGAWQSLNLGLRSGDDPDAVNRNRAELRRHLPQAPLWLHQVHGTRVVRAQDGHSQGLEPRADASVSFESDAVCAVLAADCLPVLFCNRHGTRIGAAHAGWRGLAAGVLERTVEALETPPAELLAWLGPAIGPDNYEVGKDVLAAFADEEQSGAAAFRPSGDRWHFDLYAMARFRLAKAGVGEVHGGGFDTCAESERFFSHRRDGVTGRMATLIWLTN